VFAAAPQTFIGFLCSLAGALASDMLRCIIELWTSTSLSRFATSKPLLWGGVFANFADCSACTGKAGGGNGRPSAGYG
jgi:hypothetical protein